VQYRRYNIIYADPPWSYDNPKDHNPAMGGISYPTMTLDEIKSLAVPAICERDCSLLLWATMPKLAEAFGVIEAWGFRYVTCAFTWVKLNPGGSGIYSGLGHWTNGNAELCLFAKRGRPKRVQRNVKQIQLHPRTRHSAKPPEIRNEIVRLLGDHPRIELFARSRIAGWDAWGNEVRSDVALSSAAAKQ